MDAADKVNSIKEIFINSGAVELIKTEIESYTEKAFEALEELEISIDKKELLRNFGNGLMQREV